MGSFVLFNKYNGDRQAQGQSDTQAAFRQTHTAEITDRPVNINYEQTEDIEERSGEFKRAFLDQINQR